MFKLKLFYFLTFHFVLSLQEGDSCPSNEISSTCAQPKTCVTCVNPRKCSNFDCKEGCDCVQGYYRNEKGKCIPRHHCPVPEGICQEDEAYYDAVPSCKNNCEMYGNPGVFCAPGPAGCFCKEGLVKRKDGKCVRYEECDLIQQCVGMNEEYRTCGTYCPLTCDNYYRGSGPCIQACKEGCFCRTGFVRNRNRNCVHPSQCNEDRPCPPNEVFSRCAEPCMTCEMPYSCTPLICSEGCQCIQGYYRNERRTCVPRHQCTVPEVNRRCSGMNEEYTTCGSYCVETCDTYGKGRSMACIQACKEGCVCRRGFIRNRQGVCVHPSQCRQDNNQCSSIYEEYSTCGSYCPLTCDNYDKNLPCVMACREGCFCKRGLVRSQKGECIHPSHCQRDMCPINEEVVPCAKPRWCNTCRYKGNCKVSGCMTGCDCRRNHFRNEDGFCIPEAYCPMFY